MTTVFPLQLCGIRPRFLALTFFCLFSPTILQAQYDLSGFLPPGVSLGNATPQQITEAVLAAAKQNPDAAADIATGSFQSVFDAGRYTLPGTQDGKQATDPDGSAGDPSLEEWAQMIGDAAKQANPAMAPQIDAAMGSALAAAQTAVASGAAGASGGDGGGGSGGSGPPAPMGFGGGGGGGTSSTGDS